MNRFCKIAHTFYWGEEEYNFKVEFSFEHAHLVQKLITKSIYFEGSEFSGVN